MKREYGTVILYKQPHYYSGMYILLKWTQGNFWQQISPNYTYKKALLNWAKKNNIQITND